jgi:hypothetical protein
VEHEAEVAFDVAPPVRTGRRREPLQV